MKHTTYLQDIVNGINNDGLQHLLPSFQINPDSWTRELYCDDENKIHAIRKIKMYANTITVSDDAKAELDDTSANRIYNAIKKYVTTTNFDDEYGCNVNYDNLIDELN